MVDLVRGRGWIGRQDGRRASGRRGQGYACLPHAIDRSARVVCSESLAAERQETAAGCWQRAHAGFARIGITVTGGRTDHGSCYQSRAVADALEPAMRHRRTRPYRPQPHGKVERFNRTLLAEWAYAIAYDRDAARSATYQDKIHWYTHHRPHPGIGGQLPAQRHHNRTGKYT